MLGRYLYVQLFFFATSNRRLFFVLLRLIAGRCWSVSREIELFLKYVLNKILMKLVLKKHKDMDSS